MSAQTIYNTLIAAGMTHAGACGMLGNMKAESGLIANIAQRGMTSLTDEEYTEKFDREPETCYKDGVGYGLYQLTYWTRKRGYSEYAHSKGVSVGDEQTQVEYCIIELKSYPTLWKFLCTTDEVITAADRICSEFERPAVNNFAVREKFAQTFAQSLKKAEAVKPAFPPDLSIMILQTVLNYNNYPCDITGYKDSKFLAALREFTTDVGG